ncbi:hypothetical protein FKW77_004111 [Venturia effusa]|uniref:Uncharacterized protein n=1 Tax=Venturia effusa TaxID=50376 RepID=A0A517L922_9PEZI|nr:hypothetical protein FKW77_004111 [Venturia effusa]
MAHAEKISPQPETADSNAIYLTAHRFLLWAMLSNLNLGLAIQIEFLKFSPPTTPIEFLLYRGPFYIGMIGAHLFYAFMLRDGNRNLFLKSLRFFTVHLPVLACTLMLVPWFSKSWYSWEMYKAFELCLDTLFILLVGLDFALILEYFTRSFEINWARAERFFVPSGESKGKRGQIISEAIRSWLRLTSVIGIFIFFTIIVLPPLVFAWPTLEEIKDQMTIPSGLSLFGRLLLKCGIYPGFAAFAHLVCRSQAAPQVGDHVKGDKLLLKFRIWPGVAAFVLLVWTRQAEPQVGDHVKGQVDGREQPCDVELGEVCIDRSAATSV